MMNVQWLSRTDILPYFHSNKWDCHSFMDTLEDMRFLIKDKGQLSTHSRSTKQSISIYVSSQSPNSHKPMWTGTDDLHTQCLALQKRDPKLWEPESFRMGGKHSYSLLQNEILSLLYWSGSVPVHWFRGRHYFQDCKQSCPFSGMR